MMNSNLKRVTLKPSEVSAMFGIPEGTLANMRWAKKGPRYFRKPGGRGIYYIYQEILDWVTSQPVLTVDSLPENQR